MKKLAIPLLLLLVFSLVPLISATEKQIYFFYGAGCIHCANVEASGILEKVESQGFNINKYDVGEEEGNRLYNQFRKELDIPPGWPLLIIDCGNSKVYLRGDNPIIENLENSLNTCLTNSKPRGLFDKIRFFLENKFRENLDVTTGKLSVFGWLILILSGVIDSINPCAFGVLIFLMLSLLKIGSSKRALRYGLVYSLIVFIIYFLAGFGIFRAIQSFTSITHFIYITAGVLVLLLGLWQFKDVFLPKIGPALQITPKAKPLMEKIIQKGTLPSIILLGILVSIFELPCTGGVYLAIIAILSKYGVFPAFYLAVYNLIFILPLIILTFIIYKGTSPEMLQRWTQKERKWMKLASGTVLVLLGLYILLFN